MTERKHPSGAVVAAAIAAVLLDGCTRVPAYERPAAPVPQAFAADLPAAASAVPDWPAYFTDPALHALIEAALANNRDMRIALARVEEARALAGVARADRFPTVAAQADTPASRRLDGCL